MEYFAARKLLQEFNLRRGDVKWINDLLLAHWQSDNWSEVFFLLMALLGSQHYPIDEIVSFILQNCKDSDGTATIIFAARCVTEARLVNDNSLSEAVLTTLTVQILTDSVIKG
jgi:hypothetical protein